MFNCFKIFTFNFLSILNIMDIQLQKVDLQKLIEILISSSENDDYTEFL
jgi:hypothetical protein